MPFHAISIEEVRQVTWFSHKYSKEIWDIFEVFGIVDNGQDVFFWPHANDASDDLIAICTGPFQKPVAFIVADRRYGQETRKGIWEYRRELSVSASVVLARAQALKMMGGRKGPTFCASMNSPRLWCNRTRIVVLQSAAKGDTQRLRTEAKRLCKENTRWPPVERFIRMVAERGMKGRRHRFESDGLDVCLFAAVCPHALARRRVRLERGKVIFDNGTRELLPDVVEAYLVSVATAPQLVEFVTSSEIGDRDKNSDYIARMKPIDDDVSGVLGESPPCIKGLLKSQSVPWNNEIRFQLAYVLRSAAQITGKNIDQLSKPFLYFMESNDFGKHRIKHFEGHLRRNSMVAIDRRPCASRKHGGIVCPFGGGEEGVRKCAASNSVKSLDLSSITIAKMWTTNV